MSTATDVDVHPLYLNGDWVESGEPRDVVDPATGEVFAQVATVTRDQVRKALEDAQAAWPAWRRLTGRERGRYLYDTADRVEERADDFARTITQENGKPLAQSEGEVAGTIDHLRWFAEEARRAYGRIVPHQAYGKRHLVVRAPVGVAGAIAPWNFPLILGVRKVAPALAAGCPVILKPAGATPISTLMFADAVHKAGLPPGVFQVVLGSADEIGAEFLDNPICRKISFTGSTEVGRKLIAGSADQIKNLSLELGGHGPLLVFDDADFDLALEGTLDAKFRNTGQSCIAANRVYVQRGIYEKFLAAFVEKTRSLKIGNGMEDGVEIGPLINEDAVEHALAQIEQAKLTGATVECGGRRWQEGESDCFLEPTILTSVPEDAACMTEETFAPVAPVVVFDTEDEAIRRANDTPYGLSAYAFTTSLSRTWRLAEQLEAGSIGINDGVPSTSQCPFGGLKQSGLGRELGMEGLDAFLETKHVSIGGVE